MNHLGAACPPAGSGWTGLRKVANSPGWIAAGLGLVTLAIVGNIVGNDFVALDDHDYVLDNPTVRQGLTWRGVVWAFGTLHSSNWHPVTWLSHMLDCQLWGLNPAGHHLTSVLLHLLATLLLFCGLRELFPSEVWRPAFVAAAFAVHPMHVESVAWVAERKDLLCAVFCFACLISYVRYARFPSLVRYGWAGAWFGLALMSKPMAVTWPFVLLLLDHWPLRRPEALTRRWLEKTPLLLMSAGSCLVTFIAQGKGGAVSPFAVLPLSARVANAGLSYASYVGKAFWPIRLSVFYPLSVDPLQKWEGMLALAGVFVTCAVAYRARHVFPALLVGWLWFVGMFIPVIGIVQVGAQAMADRYTYLPYVGLFIALAWSWPEGKGARACARLCGALALAGLATLTIARVGFWRDSQTLFRQALTLAPRDPVVLNLLATSLADSGQLDEAEHLLIELAANADSVDVLANFGALYAAKKDFKRAIHYLSEAHNRSPKDVGVAHNLALALVQDGQIDQAVVHYRELLKDHPEYFWAERDLGIALIMQGPTGEAIEHFKRALQEMPEDPLTHWALGDAYYRKARYAEAAAEFETALRLRPDWPKAKDSLALARSKVPR